MSYGRNFGMRSFENVVRDGRFRVPATGTALRIGEPVMTDVANDGKLKAATEAVSPNASCGIVVYEHIQNKSDALVTNHDAPYDSVPLGQYAQMMHGPGGKVWFKNTLAKTLYDGRTRAAFDFVVTSAGATPTLTADSSWLGKGLVPNGAGKWRLTDDSATADIGGVRWLTIEQVNPTTGLVEARFEF